MQKILITGLLLLSFSTLYYSLPLSTSSRWIIDEPTGARVKLTCANWAAHLEPMLAEGLDKKPLGSIARHVAQMGFNCVRLTWATYMFTRHANITVGRSLGNLGLRDSVNGIARYNPRLLNLSVVEAQRAVVEALVKEGVMVVLDNHLSKPMWCCGNHDGNGFFGDIYFDAKEWLHALAMVAKIYKRSPMVVGMSLRNELRGPLQNVDVWYKYMERGARTIAKANPKLLVIISGLNYDLNLNFLKKHPLNLNLKNKLVYEIHRYSFTSGQKKLWLNQPFATACGKLTQEIHKQAGFLVEGENAAPLFVSEFGLKQVGADRAASLFSGCFMGYLADMDLDWSIWALQGSYYIRNGVQSFDETYGMLDSNWSSIRNPDFHHQLHLIQHQLQDPKSNGPRYHILYHPSSGRCIQVYNNSEVHAVDCRNFGKWNHDGNGNAIRLMGTDLCLSATGDGIPASISLDCSSRRSRWELVSDSRFRLGNRDENGEYLCLEWNPDYSSRVLTRKCACLEDDNGSANCRGITESQWFKLISANAQQNEIRD